jgi:hypothetical protein
VESWGTSRLSLDNGHVSRLRFVSLRFRESEPSVLAWSRTTARARAGVLRAAESSDNPVRAEERNPESTRAPPVAHFTLFNIRKHTYFHIVTGALRPPGTDLAPSRMRPRAGLTTNESLG